MFFFKALVQDLLGLCALLTLDFFARLYEEGVEILDQVIVGSREGVFNIQARMFPLRSG